MCGRFTQKNERKEIEREFGVKIGTERKFETSFNIAPTQTVGAVRRTEKEKEFASLKWGLIPAWAKDASFAAKLINARAETLSEKASFREAYKKRRCLIPASGFYEWRKSADGKQPFYFYLKDTDIFAFGGLWEEWTDRDSGELIETCTIITTAANEVLKPVHDRMPVIIDSKNYERWLFCAAPPDVEELLKPFAPEKMTSRPVSRLVNSPANNSPELILNSR